ncbi:MAG: TraR/DksA C4-type zinc finger protein [bacterium]|nr:TraR/DksA C4-type zinc finger protein [bacterium]
MSKAKKKKKTASPSARKLRGSRPAKSSAKRRRKPAKKIKKGRRVSVGLTVVQLAKGNVLVKGNKHLSVSQAKEKRDFLLRLRDRITGQINFLATDNISRSDKDNEVSYRSEEQGTDNFDRDFALNRVSLDQDILFEINEALNRLALGTYGICDNCGRGIEKARLKIVPYARMCVACKSQNEDGQKKFKSFDTGAVFYTADKASAESATEEE